tara:strand:- start:387 stop:890 length:504 start_codon:yes stop_codon:yes gene_type:complete
MCAPAVVPIAKVVAGGFAANEGRKAIEREKQHRVDKAAARAQAEADRLAAQKRAELERLKIQREATAAQQQASLQAMQAEQAQIIAGQKSQAAGLRAEQEAILGGIRARGQAVTGSLKILSEDPRRAQTAQVDTRNRTRRGAKTTRTSLKIGSGSQSDAGSGANIAV